MKSPYDVEITPSLKKKQQLKDEVTEITLTHLTIETSRSLANGISYQTFQIQLRKQCQMWSLLAVQMFFLKIARFHSS